MRPDQGVSEPPTKRRYFLIAWKEHCARYRQRHGICRETPA